MKNLMGFAIVMLSLNFAAHAKYSSCSISDLKGHSIERMTDVSPSIDPFNIKLQNDFQGYVVDVAFVGVENTPFISVRPKGKNSIASAFGSELYIYKANDRIQVWCN